MSVTPTLAARMDLAASRGGTLSWPATAALFSISSMRASASATMAGRLSGRILPNMTRYSSGCFSPNCTWLSHIRRMSSSGWPDGREVAFARHIFFKTCGDDGVEQPFLVTEVVVEGRCRDTCQLRDLAGGDCCSAGVGQQLGGRTQQPHFGRKLAIETHNRYPSTYSNAI